MRLALVHDWLTGMRGGERALEVLCERFPGDLIGPLYFTETLTKSPLRYQADRLWVPEGPGLGVAL